MSDLNLYLGIASIVWGFAASLLPHITLPMSEFGKSEQFIVSTCMKQRAREARRLLDDYFAIREPDSMTSMDSDPFERSISYLDAISAVIVEVRTASRRAHATRYVLFAVMAALVVILTVGAGVRADDWIVLTAIAIVFLIETAAGLILLSCARTLQKAQSSPLVVMGVR